MKHINLLLAFLFLSTLKISAQKVFVMGNTKMKMEAAADQAETIWTKDKKTYILCPEHHMSGQKRGKRSLFVFDSKGKKETVKNVQIDNDAKKMHDIEKVMQINSKLFCLHSYYDKAEKKYSLFQTTLAEVDGQAEGLGREILTIETKDANAVEGIDIVFSNDSSKFIVMAYENASVAKTQKLILHCMIFSKDEFSFERDVPFSIDMAGKGVIRAKAAVSNQSTVYVMADTRAKKGMAWTQNVYLYSRDNQDLQETIAFEKGDMKNISIFDCKFDRNENLVVAGLFSNKANIDNTSGGFVYVYDATNSNFKITSVFDNDDDLSGQIRKVQPLEFAKDMLRPAKFNLYIDHNNNYFLTGQQYEDPKDYANELKGEVYPQIDLNSTYTSLYITCANSKGEVLWHKGFTGKLIYTIWEFNRLNIITQEEREIRLMALSPDKQIRFSKGAAPSEPDHKLDARNMCYIGNGRIGAIGHAMNGGGGFFLDFFDLTSIDVKGKIEVVKKKKK